MKRAIFSVFLTACLVLVGHTWLTKVSGHAGAADGNGTFLGMPSANKDNIDPAILVPLDVVNRIALEKARELWGQVTPGKPIACCDQDGNISTYMCPFRIGGGGFPNYEEIMKGVRAGRTFVKEVNEGLFNQPSQEVGEEEANRQAVENRLYERDAGRDISTHQNSPNLKPEVGVASKPPKESKAQDFQGALRSAREIELGIGEYGTIYVSARYDQYPIPLCSHYLSPYYFSGDVAHGKAKAHLGEKATLSRYYFLGRFGQYFEFTSDSARVSINAHSLEVEPIRPIPQRAPTKEQLDDIKQKWDTVTRIMGTRKGGEGS
jgi:hypothetical protein